MEGLADDWPAGRQRCIDVLCALARRGHVLEPPPDASIEDRLAWDDDRQFRHAIMRVVAAHLRPEGAGHADDHVPYRPVVSWQGGNFDFTGALIDGGDLDGIELTDGQLVFAGARFVADTPLVLRGSKFLGKSLLDVRGVRFESGGLDLSKVLVGPKATVNCSDALFENGRVDIRSTTIEGWFYLCRANFSGTEIELSEAVLRGSIDMREAKLTEGVLRFDDAVVEPERFWFEGAQFEGTMLDFSKAKTLSELDFGSAAPPTGVVLPPAP
jgi:uncharacterized protein YjbI with pentapeptide repeats